MELLAIIFGFLVAMAVVFGLDGFLLAIFLLAGGIAFFVYRNHPDFIDRNRPDRLDRKTGRNGRGSQDSPLNLDDRSISTIPVPPNATAVPALKAQESITPTTQSPESPGGSNEKAQTADTIKRGPGLKPIDSVPVVEVEQVEASSETEPKQQELSEREQQEILDKEVNRLVLAGCRVESRSESEVVLLKGERPNHLLHLILTILSFGLWAPVWAYLSWSRGVRRGALSIDKFGQIEMVANGRSPF